jgi:RHS repeat-associated protein
MKAFITIITTLWIQSQLYSQGNIDYIPFYTDATYNSKAIDVNLSVGATAGSPSVSNGAAMYSIPIVSVARPTGAVPSPSLSINYNSFGSDGLLGRGWNLEGITSVISLSQKTVAHDGMTEAACPNLEVYTIDGKKIIKDPTPLSATEQLWHYEIEDFSQIKSIKNGGIIERWEIITKDGLKMIYGVQASSRISGDNTNALNTNSACGISNPGYIFFYLDKIVFPTGKERLYLYTDFSTHTKAIDRIIDDYGTTYFKYKLKVDKNNAYILGTEFKSNILLDQIEVKANFATPGDDIVRKYNFKYSTDFINSFLSEVEEESAGGLKLNPTIFKYGDRNLYSLNISQSPQFEIPKNIDVFHFTVLNTVNFYFSYQSAQNFIDQSYLSGNFPVYGPILNTTYEEYNAVTGDFNGDGFTDVIKVYYSPANLYFDKVLAVYINQKNNTYLETHRGFDKDLIDLLTIKSKFQVVNFSDYNGDGIDDILGYSYIGTTPPASSSNTQTTTIAKTVIYTFDKSGVPSGTINPPPITLFGTSIFAPFESLNQTIYGNSFLSGDFDGDGNLDYVNILANHGGTGPNTAAYISYPSKNSFNIPFDLVGGVTSTKSNSILNSYKAVSIDFDGDGVHEIYADNYIYSIKMGIFEHLIYHGYNTNLYKQLYLGDFNGDKKTDLFFLSANNNKWYTSISNGLIFENGYSFGNQLPDIEDNDCNKMVRVADFNGDGRSDILYMNSTPKIGAPCKKIGFILFYSSGKLFESKSNSSFLINAYDDLCSTTYVGDFNADGKADLNIKDRGEGIKHEFYNICAYPQENLNKRRHIYFDETGDELVLQKIKTGFGVKTEFKYETLSRLGASYVGTYNNAYTYPSSGTDKYIYANIPLKVVYKMIGDQNLGDHEIEYKYKAALFDKKGRGFIGYREVIAIDHTYDRTSISYNSSIPSNFNPAYPYILLADKSETYQTSTSILLNWSKTYYKFNPLTATNNLSYNTEKIESFDYFSGLSTTDMVYDAYGNVKKSTSTSPLGHIKITDYSYGTTAAMRPALPEIKTETYKRVGKPDISYTGKYEYTVQNQLKKKIDFYGLPNTISTELEYNPAGLPTITKVTGAGMIPRITENIYLGNYLWKTKNALGQETVIAMDKKWNEPEVVTGIDGKSTYFYFDDWGRMTNTISYPTGNTTMSQIEWESGMTNSYGLAPIYKSIATATNKPSSETYYDKLGKTYLTKSQIANGDYTNKYTYYDKHGNNTVNYLTDDNGGFISRSAIQYDEFNRPKQTIINETSFSSPDIVMETKDYNKVWNTWEITNTVPASASNTVGKTSKIVKDLEGEVLESTEHGINPISYDYDAQGRKTKIKNGTKTLVETKYDVYGRVEWVNDNSAGLKTYEYNSLGELIKETKPNGFTVLQYDAVGRKIKQIVPEGTITLDYFGNNLGVKTGKLKKVSGYIIGNYDEYDYDNLGLMSKHTKAIAGRPGGAPFVTQYLYDAQGNMTQKTNHAGNVYTYTYTALGALDEVLKASTSIYKVQSYKPTGAIGSYTLGGQLVENTYNNFQQLKGIKSGYIDDVYDWDPINGNLMSKDDNKLGFHYSYEYDKFERLTLEDLKSHSIQNDIDYLDNGNIDYKGSAGDYKYNLNTTKDFAVQKIEHAHEFSPYKQEIEYTSYDRPFELRQHIYKLSYSYDHSYQRVKGVLFKNNIIENTRYYAGSSEINYDASGTVRNNIEYITANGQLVAIDVYEAGQPSSKLWYVQTDYQSTIRAVYDGSGTVYQQAFDAWGVPRDLNSGVLNHAGKPAGLPDWLYRGYTGQEHLYEFGLINLNARLYDPHNSRMLGPDVRDYGDNLQGYNKYSYCHNNPLKYTDQDGEVIAPVVAAFLIGAAIGGGSYIGSLYIQEILHPGSACFDIGQFLISAGIGALTGYCTFGIGVVLKHTVQDLGTELVRATFHSAISMMVSGAQGGDLGSSFASAFVTNMLSAGFAKFGDIADKSIDNYAFNCIIGGVSSEIGGGSFVQGAANAAMVTALNQYGGDIIRNAEIARAAKTLMTGWTAALTEPSPYGEAAMAVATGLAIAYYGNELTIKMEAEIARLKLVDRPKIGVQYRLEVTVSGEYLNKFGDKVYLPKGAIYKYGETTNPETRYAESYLKSNYLIKIDEYIGNQTQIKVMEKIKIYGYYNIHGSLPPGNKIFR